MNIKRCKICINRNKFCVQISWFEITKMSICDDGVDRQITELNVNIDHQCAHKNEYFSNEILQFP